MSKEKKISEMENKKEQFVALAKEVYPLIEQIREALAKSPFGESASISISTDGYMEFRPYDSGWRLNRSQMCLEKLNGPSQPSAVSCETRNIAEMSCCRKPISVTASAERSSAIPGSFPCIWYRITMMGL